MLVGEVAKAAGDNSRAGRAGDSQKNLTKDHGRIDTAVGNVYECTI